MSAVVLLAVQFILMEAILRLFSSQITYSKALQRFLVDGKTEPVLPFFEPSDVLPFTITPHSQADIFDSFYGTHFRIRLNGAGFRTRELTPRQSNAITRIAILGDSTTFGMGVDENDTYSTMLESSLNKEVPGNFEVFNLGVPGYGPADYYVLANMYLPSLQPDIVITSFPAPNDLIDLIQSHTELGGDGLPVRVKRAGAYIEDHRLHTDEPEARIYRLPIIRDTYLGIFLGPRIIRGIRYLAKGMKRTGEVTPEISLDRLFEGINKVSADIGAKTIWLIYPAERNVDSSDDLPFVSAASRVKDSVSVNMFPVFRSRREEPGTFFVDGSHFSRKGSEVIVASLVSEIKKLELRKVLPTRAANAF